MCILLATNQKFFGCYSSYTSKLEITIPELCTNYPNLGKLIIYQSFDYQYSQFNKLNHLELFGIDDPFIKIVSSSMVYLKVVGLNQNIKINITVYFFMLTYICRK